MSSHRESTPTTTTKCGIVEQKVDRGQDLDDLGALAAVKVVDVDDYTLDGRDVAAVAGSPLSARRLVSR